MNQSWRLVRDAPRDIDVELSVIDAGEVHAVVFACRYTGFTWVAASDGRRLDIRPTHWRPWDPGPPVASVGSMRAHHAPC